VTSDKPATKPNADAAAMSRLVLTRARAVSVADVVADVSADVVANFSVRERVTVTFVSPGAVGFRRLCRHRARSSVVLSADTARSE
jgi:hypothetical protein